MRVPRRFLPLVALAAAAIALPPAGARPTSLERLVDLAAPNVSVQVIGRQEKDQLGNDLRAGDLNADGLADLAIGAHWGSIGGRNIQGRSYVLFGRPGWPAQRDLASAAQRDWSFMGTGLEARMGSAVAVGDLSGDGVADLALGSVLADPFGQANGGGVYLMFGGPKVGGEVDFLNATPDVFLAGASFSGGEPDRLGTDLAIGDLNGDGQGDLAVAAAFRSGFRGAVFVWWGPFAAGSSRNLQNNPADWTLLGPSTGAYLGAALAIADLDQDGLGELLASAYTPAPGAEGDTGAVFIFRGRRDLGGSLDLATASADSTVIGPPGALLGAAMSPGSCSCRGQPLRVADLTGDGRPDLLAGAPLDNNRRGAAYLVPGPLEAGTIDLATRPHLRLVGTATEGRAGWTVATGQLDRDGARDLLVAAPWAGAGARSTAGLLYGLRGPFPADGALELGEATVPFLARGGEAGAGNAGTSLVLADTSGDGLDDLHIGLPDAAPLGRRSVGSVFVLHGPILANLPTATPTASATERPSPSPTATAPAVASDTPTATEGPVASPTTTTPPPDPTASETPRPATAISPAPTEGATLRTPTRTRARPGATVHLPMVVKPRRTR